MNKRKPKLRSPACYWFIDPCCVCTCPMVTCTDQMGSMNRHSLNANGKLLAFPHYQLPRGEGGDAQTRKYLKAHGGSPRSNSR